MSRILAVSTFLVFAASPALAFADLPTGPSPGPHPRNPEPAPEPTPDPEPPTEPALDTGPMEAEPPKTEGGEAKAEDTKAEDTKAEDTKTEGGEAKAEKHPEKTSDGGDKAKTDAETKKGGSCSVEDETSSLLGFAALALLLSGVALRRRE